MLINVFDNWINPRLITCIVEESGLADIPGYAVIHFSGGNDDYNNTYRIAGKTANEVAEEINKNWPVLNVEAHTTNHY